MPRTSDRPQGPAGDNLQPISIRVFHSTAVIFMTYRSHQERLIQALAFEIVGILLVAPAYALIFGAGAGESLLVTAALSLTVVAWIPVFNAGFDWAEFRLCRRLASDRPYRARVCHALLQELTACAATAPLLLILTGLSIPAIIALNIGLTAFYSVYAYVFYLAYDRVRPLRLPPAPALRQAPTALALWHDGQHPG